MPKTDRPFGQPPSRQATTSRPSIDILQAGAGGDVVRFGWRDAETSDKKASYLLDAATGSVLADERMLPRGGVEFGRQWLVAQDRRTNDTRYQLLALDGTTLGRVLEAPAGHVYATDRALLGVDTRFGVDDAGRVDGTVEVAPWGGTQIRRIALDERLDLLDHVLDHQLTFGVARMPK